MLLEDSRPARGIAASWKNWAFALALGLLVCVSDIRLPGESVHAGAVANVEAVAGVLASSDFFTGDMDDLRFVDVPATDFVPPGEPALLPFDRIIHEAAGRYGLDANLIAAVIMAESQFNPGAVSKKGAKGLMQIMPVTADALDITDVLLPRGKHRRRVPPPQMAAGAVRRGRTAGARRLQRRPAERAELQRGPPLPGDPSLHRQGHGALLGDSERVGCLLIEGGFTVLRGRRPAPEVASGCPGREPGR